MKKILQLTVLLLLVVVQQGFAQDRQVKGKVTDASDGSGLPGVAVKVKGSTRGTVTDVEGNYKINVGDKGVLVFSSVGFGTKEMPVGSATEINVGLAESTSSIDEVIVTALGIEKSQKQLTYAAQKIGGDKINEVRDANFVTTLSGKVAGIAITQGAGGPGSAARVILRGNRSIGGNNNALYVVDGVVVDNSVGGQVGNDFGGKNGNDAASNINPDDIESVNILKGAAASVLYGSRAANGVIMITTKRGKAGKTSVDVNSGFVTESPLLLPDLQNTYVQGNGGDASTKASGSWGSKGTTYANNIKDFFRNAMSYNNSISIAGGTDKMQTYMSYTNNYNQGLVDGNDLTRHTINLRVNNQVSKKFSTDLKITFVNQEINNKVKVGEESGVVMNIYKIPRSVDLNTVKNYQDPVSGAPLYWTTSSIYTNPYWTVNNTPSLDSRNRITAMGSAKYQIADFLSVMGRVSLDKYGDNATQKFYDQTLLFAQKGGNYSVSNANTTEQTLELLLQGGNSLTSDLKVDYIFGTSINDRKFVSTVTNASGLLVPNKFDLNFARTLSVNTADVKQQLQSVYGKVGFSYKDYLLLDVTARNDWSSTLPAPHSYFYPSVGLTALLSDFIEMPVAISFAKFRASLTQVGNEASPYRLAQTFGFGQGGSGGFVSRDGTKAIEDLKPEITTSFETGLDFRFIKNRFGLDFTYYKTNSRNQLLVLPLAAASGFSSQYINAGNIQNEGFEITLNAKILQGKDFTWDANLNMAKNKNTVVELSPDIKRAFLGGGYGRTGSPLVEEGGSYGDLYAFKWKRSPTGEFVVDANGKPITNSDQEFIGNFNPDLTMGLNNSFTYKNFSANLLFTGSFGGTMVSGSEANFAFDGTAAYTTNNRDAASWILPAVTATGEKNTKAISAETFWSTVSGGRYSWGEFFAYDATNIRLRELSVGYNIKTPANFFIKSAKLSLVGRNLFFLYRGKALLNIPGVAERTLPFDPEINLGAGNFQGVEYGNLPSSKTIGLNLKLSF
jgi:TonB-linked SusC/RagA family outer membrane protein